MLISNILDLFHNFAGLKYSKHKYSEQKPFPFIYFFYLCG